MEEITENPEVGATEVWEFYNTTGDAHPMHIHEVAFEVVNREGLVLDEDGEVEQPIQLDGNVTGPEPWETGFKDTVTAYPGQVTRVRAQFNNPGQYVWHCHIVEHEDNEMMRPFRIGPEQDGPTGGVEVNADRNGGHRSPVAPVLCHNGYPMGSLKRRLIERISVTGPIPFEEFMAAALYDPADGFFTSKTLRSVKAGDFLTSPEVSPLFGETLARFVDQELSTSPWKGEVPERSEGDGGRALPGESESEAATPFSGPRTADGAPGIVPPASEAGSGGVQVDGSGIVPPVSEASLGGKVPQPERSAGWGRGALLIEVGAGSGSLLKPLLATLQTTVEPWAVEASPAARRALEDSPPARPHRPHPR